MSWLAPLFLLGALAVAAPFVAHLVRRATRERIPFSATCFLEPSLPRLSRRSRIENPWLLALRILVVLGLAAGFARPFLGGDSPILPQARTPAHVVAVLDESASMRRSELAARAQAGLMELARSLAPADEFAVLGAGEHARVLLSSGLWRSTRPDDRAAFLASLLAGREAGWSRTNLDTTLLSALEELEGMGGDAGAPGPSRIVVFSDLAEGTRIANLAGVDWPSSCSVELVDLAPPAARNASLRFLGWTPADVNPAAARLRLAHDAPGISSYRLQLRDAATGAALGEAHTETLAPMETRVVVVEIPAGAPAALRVDLEGDDEEFDNTAWFVRRQPRDVATAYIGAHDPEDSRHPAYYLSRALDGLRDPVVTIRSVSPMDTASLPDAPLFVVAEPFSDAVGGGLRERIEAGATALVIASQPQLVEAAGRLAGDSSSWQAGAFAGPDALLGEIDFTHPLFSLFADPRYSDFTRVRFWKPLPLLLPEGSRAAVIARFEDRSPAVVESSVGSGRLVVWGGGWNPEAGQWVLSSKFVPWVHHLLLRAMGGPAGADSADAGDTAPLAASPSATWARVDRSEVSPSATRPDAPGIYALAGERETRLVALQVPATESLSGTLPLDAWEQLGVPVGVGSAAPAHFARSALGRRNAEVMEGEQKLWRWLLLGVAMLLAVESVVAIRTATRTTESG